MKKENVIKIVELVLSKKGLESNLSVAEMNLFVEEAVHEKGFQNEAQIEQRKNEVQSIRDELEKINKELEEI